MVLLEAFAELPDPRAENRRYPLPQLIFIAITMVLSSADDWEMVEELAKTKVAWLKKFIPLPHVIPSHDTFGRVFARLDPQAFQAAFVAWVAQVSSQSAGEIIAIDGKTLRRSYDTKDDKAAIHMVNAWACKTGMILGQLKTEAKSNEITAIPTLLDQIEIAGGLISIDAMGCQRKIAQKILEREADYLLALKRNQGTLYENVKLFLDDLATKENLSSEQYHETIDKGHGRIEVRRGWVIHNVEWLQAKHKWPGLKMIGMVEGTQYKGEHVSTERRYYVSSRVCDAQSFMEAVRSHWQVESLHWILDIGFCEDDCRIRKDHGPENMALFRQIAVNLLKQDKTVKLGIRNRRTIAAADDNYRERLLQGLKKQPTSQMR